MFLDFKLKAMHFYRRNKKKVYILAIAIGVTITVNTYLGYLQSMEPPTTSYTPHNPIIYGEEITSKEEQSVIEEKIETYMDYCNKKDYRSAYDCLSDECKKYKFKNNLQEFVSYVDYVFDGKKIYAIQDLSNKDDIYVYKVTITEDILATGMNNENSELKYDEYIGLRKYGNGFKLSVDGFLKTEYMDLVYEDEYMEAQIIEKIINYETVTYKFKVTNKTKNDIILASSHDDKEFVLSLNGEYRIFKEDEFEDKRVVIPNEQSLEFSVTFGKYYDEVKKETEVVFNKIRVLKDYTGVDSRWEKELKDTVKAYSVIFKLNK